MFVELEIPCFGRVRPLFEEAKRYIPVFAVLEGSYPGRVFVDSIQDPRVAIVWAIGRWAYIEGNPDSFDLVCAVPDFINRIAIPDSLRMDMNWFELYAMESSVWIRQLDEWLRTFAGSRHYERTYKWDEPAYQRFRSQYAFPDSVAVETVDIPILSERIRESPFVPDDFKTRTAICFNAKVNNEVVAFCRSDGLASGREFMVDVEIPDSNLRGRGYATAAAVGLLDNCLKKGLVPLWETTEDNQASQRLASKLGFVDREKYPVYALEF